MNKTEYSSWVDKSWPCGIDFPQFPFSNPVCFPPSFSDRIIHNEWYVLPPFCNSKWKRIVKLYVRQRKKTKPSDSRKNINFCLIIYVIHPTYFPLFSCPLWPSYYHNAYLWFRKENVYIISHLQNWTQGITQSSIILRNWVYLCICKCMCIVWICFWGVG